LSKPQVAPHKPAIATYLKSSNDHLFSQTHPMFKAIAHSFHKPTIATHFKSNYDRTNNLYISLYLTTQVRKSSTAIAWLTISSVFWSRITSLSLII